MHEVLDLISKDPRFKDQLAELNKDEQELVNTYIFELSAKVEKLINISNEIMSDPEKSQILLESLNKVFETGGSEVWPEES